MVHKFYIYGYYGSKNAGDEAFRLAFQKLLPSGSENHFIRPSELSGNGALAEHIRQDVNAGIARLIVGGGAIIGEPYFWENLPEKTPYHLVSADIGSQEHLLKSYLPSLKPLQASWIRSESDAEQLSRLAPWQEQIHYLPDIVFSLEASATDREEIKALPAERRNRRLLALMGNHCENTMTAEQLRNKNIAIFLSDHYYDYKTIQCSTILEGVEREAADKIVLRNLRLAIDELTAYYNLYFFSLSYWYNAIDAFTAYRLAKSSSKAPLYNITSGYIEPNEIIQLMPYFDAAISTKFHGLIFPMTAQVPVMNLGNSKKNLDLTQQMGLASIEPDEFNVNTFLKTLKQVESVEYATSLAETTRLARESIITTFASPGLWGQ